jgi:hypothetical protein
MERLRVFVFAEHALRAGEWASEDRAILDDGSISDDVVEYGGTRAELLEWADAIERSANEECVRRPGANESFRLRVARTLREAVESC